MRSRDNGWSVLAATESVRAATRANRRLLVGCAILITACASANGTAPQGFEARATGAFRFLTWNVSDSEWVKHFDDSRAVLRYADPDIVTIIEIAPALSAVDVRRMLSGLRGP